MADTGDRIKFSGDGITVIDAVNGEFDIVLLPKDTSELNRSCDHPIPTTFTTEQ